MFPDVSTNAPALIDIVISPPVKLLIVNGNVFVLSFNVAVPNVTFAVFPPIVTVTFEEFSTDAVLFNPVSSVPIKFNVYVLPESFPLLIDPFHTGGVASTENE